MKGWSELSRAQQAQLKSVGLSVVMVVVLACLFGYGCRRACESGPPSMSRRSDTVQRYQENIHRTQNARNACEATLPPPTVLDSAELQRQRDEVVDACVRRELATKRAP